jgi:subtilisin family serine protease
MPLFVRIRLTLAASLASSVLAVAPARADNTDRAVRAAVESGQSARVIMQFATSAERDRALTNLLDRGAAVRVADTSAGPALIVLGSAEALKSELSRASRVSLDASVQVLSQLPARAVSSGDRVSGPGRLPTPSVPPRSSISVAIIDSGIAPHADLPLSRIRAFKDFVSGVRLPIDTCGHGTHVAGIVAGSGLHSNGAFAGIAPNVDIVALRVLGDDCSGNTSDVIDALEWVARHHEAHKIKIVNISLGHAVLESIFTDPLVQAVERLSRLGITIVTAAGNKGLNPSTGLPGFGGVGVPCNAPSSICVGALDTRGTFDLSDDRVADASSRGPTRFDLLAKPDLVAPGASIVSLAARGSRLFSEFEHLRVPGSTGLPEYFVLSGTSMASPAVAGAAALLLGENPGLPIHALKISLQFTARLVDATDVLTQGAGALNIPGALTLASAIDPDVPRGENWIRHRLTAANGDAAGNAIPWSRRIIYGDRFVDPSFAEFHLFRWDDDIVWAFDAIAAKINWHHQSGGQVVWGHDDVVWGNEDTAARGRADSIAWGNRLDDSIVWGNSESDNIVWGIDDWLVWGNDDSVAWGNSSQDNLVWGNGYLRDVWASNVVWGFWEDNVSWNSITRDTTANILWGTALDNVCGTIRC